MIGWGSVFQDKVMSLLSKTSYLRAADQRCREYPPSAANPSHSARLNNRPDATGCPAPVSGRVSGGNGVAEGVAVGNAVAVLTGATTAGWVGVSVGSGAAVGVSVGKGVEVGVFVGRGVAVGVSVGRGVAVGVFVGC